MLAAPPGRESLPAFDHGWVTEDDLRAPFLTYTDRPSSNWSDELELLHDETSRTHFLDIWTREAIIRRLGPLGAEATVVDLGAPPDTCSKTSGTTTRRSRSSAST